MLGQIEYNIHFNLLKFYDIVKSLILLAPQAIVGFIIRLAKLQELGLTPSNSLQLLTSGYSSIFF